MKDVGNNIIKSLQKRQEALTKYVKRKEDFLLAKENIMKEIKEASILWKKTLEQTTNREFK
ncbi:MAG: hypothetical protein Q8O72_14815 [Bacteroidales bacterium]|jgi:hypothetical protein|nr:hypothetical protein [Bacteroidales bacterium]